ncbi:ATP-binding protein [Flavobacterium alkalisoli]|uniref:ATP-binding protein n=1 Tax=Flavobacterium alkalisoli TaxID=2602769 RepID=A0A5B9FUL8_9FLAO|nr:AAA family ATPase [Flavobacterium alkalisoli]QEE50695.1 ATP-binding protein [Flavobacterium alkalisoli]
MNFSKVVKLSIINYLKEEDVIPFWNKDKVISFDFYDFINKIAELDIMPSQIAEFENAKEEIENLLNKNEITFEEVLIERLNILNDNNLFQKLIEEIVSKEDIEDAERKLHLFAINNYLENDKLILKLNRKNNKYSVIGLTEDIFDEIELRKSQFNFIVINKNEIHRPVDRGEYFLLREDTWDDFNSVTTFGLSYYKGNTLLHNFGYIKIMIKSERITMNVIPKKFHFLPQKFCSLGQTEIFYKKMNEIFSDKFVIILSALCDCAFFPEKLEQFENHPRFINSLIRDDDTERVLRTIRHTLFNHDISNMFSFIYKFKPPYSKTSIDVGFNFPNNQYQKFFYPRLNTITSNRIYAIIGKNGTGKTQLLNSIPKDFMGTDKQNFVPRQPSFSNIIHISYSIFDSFKPSTITNKKYVYCGLKDEKGDLIDSKRLLLRFHNSWKKIKFNKRMYRWKELLSGIIDMELLDNFIIDDLNDNNHDNRYTVDIPKFHKTREKLSSGQNILLFIITEIVANIKYDSLVLYDEPETHLHPNAITQLIGTIYHLVDEFQSFCIVGTHSPLIIQELLSKNVLVIEKDGEVASIRKIEIESFGENLSKLTEDVFGNRDTSKKYKEIISQQVNNDKTYDEIVEMITSDGVPLSLNTRLFIAGKISQR